MKILNVLERVKHYMGSGYFYRPQRSCGKVIFSQACVSHSVHRDGVSASVHAGIHTPQAGTPPPHWAGTPPGRCTPMGRYTPWQVQPPFPTTVTAADGKHPTGMLSCKLSFLLVIVDMIM